MRCLVFFSTILFFCYCTNTGSKHETEIMVADTLQVDMHRLPELKTVDSIDMHFFNDINDQKLYTRFGLNDTSLIQVFTIAEINHSFIDKTSCEYDTKFFCFSKGQIVKTLYVAAIKDSCRFIGFIKSGGIAVKAQLSDTAAALVNQWRARSVK